MSIGMSSRLSILYTPVRLYYLLTSRWHSLQTRPWPPNDFGKSDVTHRFVSLSHMPGSDFDFSLSITHVFWHHVVLLLLSLLSFSRVYTDGIVCAVNFTATIRSAEKYVTSILLRPNIIRQIRSQGLEEKNGEGRKLIDVWRQQCYFPFNFAPQIFQHNKSSKTQNTIQKVSR